jgi:hypothetical protein
MSDDDKERTVNFGCGVWVFLGLLIGALWNIHAELRHVSEKLTMANCLTEAEHGITCPEAKK